jgi:hypothetical protein
MAKYIYLAFSDCKDPSREEEYTNWYQNMHIPDMLETPGMIRATFWEAADGKGKFRRKYLALYEFETEDIEEFNRKLGVVGRGTMEKGRFSDLPAFDPPDVPREYRQIMPAKKAKSKKV